MITNSIIQYIIYDQIKIYLKISLYNHFNDFLKLKIYKDMHQRNYATSASVLTNSIIDNIKSI